MAEQSGADVGTKKRGREKSVGAAHNVDRGELCKPTQLNCEHVSNHLRMLWFKA